MLTSAEEAVKEAASITILLLLFYAIGKALDAALECMLALLLSLLVYVAKRQKQVSWTQYDGTLVTISFEPPHSVHVTLFPRDGRLPLYSRFVLSEAERQMWQKRK